MNQVNLIGNLCRDHDITYTPSGAKILNNTIAVRRNYKNQQGEYDSDFINFVAFKIQADYLEKYTSKGDKISINGKWRHRSYDAKDGTKRFVDECVVNEVSNLTKKTDKPPIEESEADDNPFAIDDLPF